MQCDTIQGVNLERAKCFLDSLHLVPQEEIVVGVIDSGVDTTFMEVRKALWHNPLEKKDGMDNDANGYPDDLHGWNFLGTADGSFNMTSAGREEFREFKRLYPKYKGVEVPQPEDAAEYAYFQEMERRAGIKMYVRYVANTLAQGEYYARLDSLLGIKVGSNRAKLPLGEAVEILAKEPKGKEALEVLGLVILKAGEETPWSDFLGSYQAETELMRARLRSIEEEPDKRLLMGDAIEDEKDRYYGNPILQVEGYEHGTFVASLIAGQGVVDYEVTGIYPASKLMILRALPEGDEYDKDVASALYYAVENGAKVINMSFGKYLSPSHEMVQRAISYAGEQDVLLIHSAGNDASNIDSIPYYPMAWGEDGERFGHLVRVGASNHRGEKAPFSNYGASEVDVFAPGTQITGVIPGGVVEQSRGTSLSAPIVSGIAALIRAYFPMLSAKEVKHILLKSSRKLEALTPYARSGGIVDAEQAVRLAYEICKDEMVEWHRVERMSAAVLDDFVKEQRIFPIWIPDSHYFYYHKTEKGEKVYYLFNAKNGRKEQLIPDTDLFAKQYETLVGERLDTENLQLNGLRFSDRSKNELYLKCGGKWLRYNRKKQHLSLSSEQEARGEEETNERRLAGHHSADSLYTMLGSRYDLFVRDNLSGEVIRITNDGKEGVAHTYRHTTDTVEGNSRGLWVGKVYLHLLRDESKVGEMTIVDALSEPRPKANTFKMPLPGDKELRQYHLFWYHAPKRIGGYVEIEKYPDQEVQLDTYSHKGEVYLTRMARGAKAIDLCRLDLETGTLNEIISEKTEPHLNLSLHNYKVTEDGKHIIWWSERTGRGNYYLYTRDGRLLHRITHGENLVAGRIVHIDSKRGEMIFAGFGNEPGADPSYPYYYKTKLNGRSKPQLLTPALGVHELSFSDDKAYAIDIYSRVDLPHRGEVFSIRQPSKRFPVEAIDDSALRSHGWHPPVRLKVKAADGITDLYGVMYLPTSLDKSKKYPIISCVYPGPQDDQVARTFTLYDSGNQALAELGFVVISVAPRGSSPLRGKDFHTFGYGNLRDYPLEDDRYVITQLAKEYPFIDLSRVGIFGHSGGGFQAATAILTFPEFYKVAVAASGNHDNNIYIRWWGETFHGLIDDESQRIPTNIELAPNLKGRLLLITGNLDKNVPPYSTYRLAEALIKSGKRFDFFLFPSQGHGLESPYYQNLIRYYFLEHLLGKPQKDTDIINHR